MRTIFSSLVFVLGIGAASYSQHLAPGDPAAAILHMHDLDRQAHLKGDATDLGSRLGDQILVISEGNITSENKEEMYKRFVEAFRNTEYSAWEDVEQLVVSCLRMEQWLGERSTYVHDISKHNRTGNGSPWTPPCHG